ncbi:tetratricopeptide repeat protein [Novosphingobium aquimarinum]|uniref:tetratricopeptide repeat protein n=1 Tax=Novosphingobium aquimarinum TaxID=2682494 RepID=UPI0012EBEE8D|nr:tetratricopeptide repeat protein [Novosphingobium aquimarinum]
MSPLFFFFLLAQVGAAPAIGTSPLETPPEIREQRRVAQPTAPVTAVAAPVGSAGCIAEIEADPVRGVEAAQQAMWRAAGEERVRAGLCLGMALVDLERFDEAQRAFADAREAAADEDRASRARLGAMAGNAALAGGRPGAAMGALDAALADAKAVSDKALAAEVELDRARALVALDRPAEAGSALADARLLAPGDAQAWLLSATLARRENRLDEAQQQIEEAARIDPANPEVGLEAGVIAMLGGREEAARRSWRSVMATAPGSPAAATAQGYINQLAPQPETGR